MRKSLKCFIALLSSALFAFTFPSITGAADVPKTLNYQGSLTDNAGQPVTGSHQIIFNLYNALSGGTSFWTETKTVQVVDGKFSVILGETTTLDTTQFTGNTFIGLRVDAGAEMVPRQQFTSVAYALKAGSLINTPTTTTSIMPDSIPPGVVVMWTGAANAVPSGWALCDGTNGTPDLRDRFVVGAGNSYVVGATAGSTTKDLSHSHSASYESTHTHSISGRTAADNGNRATGGSSGTASANGSHDHGVGSLAVGAGLAHTHTVNSGGSATQDIMPPYYALALIMKL